MALRTPVIPGHEGIQKPKPLIVTDPALESSLGVHSVSGGSGHHCERSEAISSGMGIPRWGWASCPSSTDRQSRVSRDVPPGMQHRQGRRCLRFGSGGRPCPPFPAPGSGSGVTNDRQSRVLRGTVPPMRLLSRGTRDFTPRKDKVGLPSKLPG